MAPPNGEIKKKFFKLDKGQLFSIFFFGLLLFLLYQLLRLVSPFIDAMLVSATLAVVFYPLHAAIRRKIVSDKTAAAALSTLTVIVTAVVPVLLFGWLLFNETRALYPKTKAWVETLSIAELESRLPTKIRGFIEVDSKDMLLRNFENVQERITRSGGRILHNIVIFVLDLLVMVFTLFFFFRDGESFIQWLIDLIPMDYDHKHRLAQQLYNVIIAVVRGIIFTALVQGVVASIGFSIAGTPAPILAGLLTFLAGLIPIGGTALVWLPMGLYMYFFRDPAWGIFVLLWGFLIIGLIDNFLRPIMIGREAKLPFFLLFLGIFGGMRVYGFFGLFLGPILVACVAAVLQIYRQEAKMFISPAGPPGPPAP
jgi:predicted PurR-regulated permease PerM